MAIGCANAQSPYTENTFVLDEPANQPTATLADVHWLVGSWAGDAFGATFEEVWNPPSADSMVGMVKYLDGDQVSFYELMLIVEEQASLNLKVKHFDADFSAWEEKGEFVNFPLVKLEVDAIHFHGLSFYRKNDDELHAFLVIRGKEGVREEKMVYRRRR
ncbi:MAG: DUF6265 family protein [Woeseiaceae bacterium]|nr:DUF6265 family protein [Woeseiaceae bacterium]